MFRLWEGKFLLVNGEFAISEDCCCPLSGELWKYCDDDEDALSVSNNYVLYDYAWFCIDGTWQKVYNSGLQGHPAVNVDVLLPPNIPTSCESLSAFPSCSGTYDPTGLPCDETPICTFEECILSGGTMTLYEFEECLPLSGGTMTLYEFEECSISAVSAV